MIQYDEQLNDLQTKMSRRRKLETTMTRLKAMQQKTEDTVRRLQARIDRLVLETGM